MKRAKKGIGITAPWYTSIVIYGGVTLSILLIVLIVEILWKSKKSD